MEEQKLSVNELQKYLSNLETQYNNLLEQQGNVVAMKLKLEGGMDVVRQMIDKIKASAPAETPKPE